MKNFCVLLLCMTQFYAILASPVAQKDVQTAETLPKNEEQVKTYHGYVPTAGIGIHKYHNNQGKNWNDARNTCLNEGGHLAIINSAAEEALIIKYMKVTGNLNADQFWIGVHEIFNKDDWISVKDQRLDAIGYVHWRNGQPDATPNEHCLTITPDGMNDYNCNQQLFFVCEM